VHEKYSALPSWQIVYKLNVLLDAFIFVHPEISEGLENK